jgi:Protein of unknown function (DUF2934)
MSKAIEVHSSPNTTSQQKSDDRQQEILQERIQKRAYELYEARGATPGQALEDWTQAEAEVLRERTIHRAA